jgi:hypothetical protein
MEMFRSEPISLYFRAVFFIQGTPLYPMEMFRSEPISHYFRTVYFHPKYSVYTLLVDPILQLLNNPGGPVGIWHL